MRIVVAAAGQGTRMQELTKETPKHLLPVLGKPFLFYLLENIKQAGFEEVIVIGGYKIEQLENFLKSYDPEIVLVNQNKHIIDGSYGSAIPVLCARYHVLEESFILISGDNLYSVTDLKKFREFTDSYVHVAGLSHENPERYGVLQAEGDFLKTIIEKPVAPAGNLINTGLYLLTKEIFPAIGKIKISSRGELELTDALNIMAKSKKVKVEKLADYWYDFGRPEDIKKIENFLNEH